MLDVELPHTRLQSGNKCCGRAIVHGEGRRHAERLSVTLSASELIHRPLSFRSPLRRVLYQHTVVLAGAAFFKDVFAFELPIPSEGEVQTFATRPRPFLARLISRAFPTVIEPVQWELEVHLERSSAEDAVQRVPLEIELGHDQRAA